LAALGLVALMAVAAHTHVVNGFFMIGAARWRLEPKDSDYLCSRSRSALPWRSA
jgi:hypothetical protein